MQRHSSALQQYTQAANEDPKWAPPRLARVRLLQANRPLDAQQELTQVEAELAGRPETIITGARLAIQQRAGQAPGVAELGRRQPPDRDASRPLSPGSPGAALLRADVLLNTGKLPEAAALLEQAVRHDKREADLWVAWAAALTRLNKIQDALRVLEQAAAPDAAGDTRQPADRPRPAADPARQRQGGPRRPDPGRGEPQAAAERPAGLGRAGQPAPPAPRGRRGPQGVPSATPNCSPTTRGRNWS